MGMFFKQRNSSDKENVFGQVKKQAKVITFLNQKGGVGKTTLSFNTAHALKNVGHKVLCIDMDPQSNLSLLFNIDSTNSEAPHIFQLLINSVKELKTLHTESNWLDVVIKGDIDIIPAGQELSGFELSVAGINSPRPLVLKRFLEKSKILESYDYIIIDSPPTLGLLVVNILCAAEGLMVPFRPDEFSKKGLSHLHEVLLDIEDMGVAAAPSVLAHIPNLVDARRKQEGSDLKSIVKDLKEDLKTVPVVEPFYNRASLVKSHAAKKSVYDYNSKDFKNLQIQFNQLVNIIEEWRV
ncbi:MAG: ParA family protein [Bacteriovoracaceae bacterium]|jgi:chromosome partitioning protein|nr:ParA family protein [Bacteriovoracaceae bacterium]